MKAGGDPCEKAEEAWIAVKAATEALTVRVFGAATPPEGWTWRRFVKEALARAGLSEGEAEELAACYIDARDRLHGACYLGRLYEEEEHKPLVEKAERYAERVRKLLETLPREGGGNGESD